MTQDEADKIARVIATANHGCSVCVSNLCELLNEADLGFSFELIDGKVAALWISFFHAPQASH